MSEKVPYGLTTDEYNQRLAGLRQMVAVPDFAAAFQELLAFADRAADPAVRCGRLDMMAHLLKVGRATHLIPTTVMTVAVAPMEIPNA